MADDTGANSPSIARWVLWGFAAIGAIAAVAAIYVALQIVSFERTAARKPAKVTTEKAEETYAVANARDVDGTDLIAITIATADSVSGSQPYSSGATDIDQRNLLILDKASGASRRVLPDNSRRIVNVHFFPAASEMDVGYEAADDEDAPTPAPTNDSAEATGKTATPMAYYVVEVRQKDGTAEDVLVGSLATGSQRFLLTGIDGIDRMWMQSPTRLALLMRKGQRLSYRAIEVPDLKTVAKRPVEID